MIPSWNSDKDFSQLIRRMINVCWIVAALSCWGNFVPAQVPSSQRSIIAIVVDDLFDYRHFRDRFGVTVQTPNLDRLASRGVVFSNAFAPVPVCNGSRTATMTGLSQFRTGLHMTVPDQWNNVVPLEHNFVTQMGKAGYRTVGAGKVFHNSSNPAQRSLFESLYDDFFVKTGPVVKNAPGRVANPLAPGVSLKDTHTTNWAVRRLHGYEKSSGPMLMTLGIVRPHRPFVVPKRFFDLYPKSEISLPQNTESDLADVSEFYKRFRLQSGYHKFLKLNQLDAEFVQGYLASTTFADSLVGQVLDAIDANPELSDATIVLWSDNGFELGEKNTYNKFTLWESSTRVPLIVVDPSAPAGTENDSPVSLLDIFPTMIDLAGAPVPEDLDGESLMNVIDDPESFKNNEVIMTMLGSIAMRTKSHRLIAYNDGSVSLFNVLRDPDNRTNLAEFPNHRDNTVPRLMRRMQRAVEKLGGVFKPDDFVVDASDKDDSIFVHGFQDAYGGAGDDTYFLAEGGLAVEDENGGFDQAIFASLEFQIPKNIESVRNHLYTNGQFFRITGNEQDNEIKISAVGGIVNAGSGDDVLILGNGEYLPNGGAGNDLIQITGETRFVVGGKHDDAIICGPTSDRIWGDAKNDPTIVADGADLIISDGIEIKSRNTFDLLFENNQLRNGSRSVIGTSELVNPIIALAKKHTRFFVLPSHGSGDEIHGGGGPDFIFSQGGDDRVFGGPGDDHVSAGDGNDLVFGNSGDDSLSGGNGDDRINGQDGEDRADGDDGNDFLSLGNGNDSGYGGSGADELYGGNGADFLVGDAGSDRLFGGTDNDQMFGGDGDDDLFGQSGNDSLHGGTGSDDMRGGSGDDDLVGGTGEDYLDGGSGNDTMAGGGNSDTFVILAATGDDVVTDLSTADTLFVPSHSPIAGMTKIEISQLAQRVGDDVIIGTPGFSVKFLNRTVAQVVSRLAFESE